jgi:hypothetical protein
MPTIILACSDKHQTGRNMPASTDLQSNGRRKSSARLSTCSCDFTACAYSRRFTAVFNETNGSSQSHKSLGRSNGPRGPNGRSDTAIGTRHPNVTLASPRKRRMTGFRTLQSSCQDRFDKTACTMTYRVPWKEPVLSSTGTLSASEPAMFAMIPP